MDLTGLSNEDLAEIVRTQASYIEKLELQLSGDGKTTKVAQPEVKPHIPEPVTIKGKRYKFRYISFRFKNNSYRADQVQYDTSILEAIIATPGQTILKEIS